MTYEIKCGDCVEVMRAMPEGCIDLTVTSPPYDGMRTYNGYVFNFEAVARELFRVTKSGGVVVWVVGDATEGGDETGTSFRQALFFKQCGFRLHDTMIYEKTGTGACGSRKAYWQTFEYMFVFSKGTPAKINLLADKKNSRAGAVCTKGRIRKDGFEKDTNRRVVPEYSIRSNVWRIQPGNNGDDKVAHPAKFPEALARDHILSWSYERDLIFDPFTGSGTTAKMAVMHNRNFIGSEISEKYVTIAKNRVSDAVVMFHENTME